MFTTIPFTASVRLLGVLSAIGLCLLWLWNAWCVYLALRDHHRAVSVSSQRQQSLADSSSKKGTAKPSARPSKVSSARRPVSRDSSKDVIGPAPAAGTSMVSKDSFDQSLHRLDRVLVSSSQQYLYGKYDEITYTIGRESFVFLAGGRAALLQLAHPFVALGVEQHSSLTSGVQERFYRTFEYIFAMTFGPAEEMFRAARAVRRLHDGVHGTFPETVGPFVKGSSYSAHWDTALFWVAATLTESSVLIYDMMVRRLSLEEKHRFYANSHRFYALFGIPQHIIPATWDQFLAYCHHMWASPTLTVGLSGRRLQHFLFKPPRAMFWPMMKWVELSTAAMLPPRIRQQFHMRWGCAEAFVFYATFGLLRLVYACMPGSMRFVDRFLEMERKQGVKRVQWPSRISLAIARFFLHSAMPPRQKSTS